MKIHQLKFKNINNLKGEHTIPFDELPLSQAGIFAIVGPTGSGKSTILDVITLALFNRIPRFKKAISKNEIANEGSVLTHHTTEASASIDYEIKGKKYRSTWTLATNRNGKLKDYEMSLYNPDGSVADLKKSEVPGQNEKIIGLSYDQFIKSILLSQGEFSKFLKAEKNDRGKLLEKITGTSIYRKIGINAFLKHKEIKEKLEREKEIIGIISTLKEEERVELFNQLEVSKKEKERLSLLLDEQTQLKQIKTELSNLNTSLEEKQKDIILINNKVSAFKEEGLKLDLHQKISHVQAPLTSYKVAESNIQKSQESLNQYQLQLEEAQMKFQKAIEDISKLTKQNVEAGSFKKIMNAFETEINNADRDLENLKKNGGNARARINQQTPNYPIALSENIKPTDAIELLEIRAGKLKTDLTKFQLDDKKSTTELRALLKQKQEELNTLKIIQDKYLRTDELQLKLSDLNKKLTKLNEEKVLKTPLVEKCQKLVEAASQKIELLIKQKEDAIKIASLEKLRHTLTSGDACPLCGSLEHPYTEHLPDQKQTEIEQSIFHSRKELKEHQKEFESSNKELTQYASSIDHTQKLIKESSHQLSIYDEDIKKTIAIFDGPSNYEPSKIAEAIKVLSKQNENTETSISTLDELNLNKELILIYNQLQSILQEYFTLSQSRKEKFEGKNINAVTNKLQDDFEANRSKITELKAVIKKESDSIKRDKEIVISIAESLNPKVKELGFKSINELTTHLLDEATVNNLMQKKDQLKNNQIKIETETKTLKKELDLKSKLDTKPDLLMQSLEVFISEQKNILENHQETITKNQQLIKRDDEDRNKVKSKEKAISKLNQELEKWALLNKMIGDANGHKFANFAQGLTLQNLLAYANHRLSNLSDRYLLDKPENDGALIVIDQYQGNTSRSVTTLSGGESFLISLALALALSDMASKNVALDCLFIDEGFGTLDPESLESALNTLEKLQSESQKTVGVISHVEALKERIDVQVKLNKNAQGYSQIEIRNNNQN